MLSLVVAKTKRYVYNNWLLKSKYEFEYNNEKMFKENPHFIDLYVGVKEKDDWYEEKYRAFFG